MKLKTMRLLAVALLFLFAGEASAAEVAGKAAKISGYVTVERGGTRARLLQGAPLYQGDVLRTAADGKVAVTFVDNSSMTISRNSELEITEYLYEKQKSRKAAFRLWSGRVRALISKFGSGTNDVKVSTPTGVAGVRGTDFVVTLEPADTAATVDASPREKPEAFQTTVAVLKGKVAVTGIQPGMSEILLGPGQASTIKFNANAGSPRKLSDDEVKQLETASAAGKGSRLAGATAGDLAGDAGAALQALPGSAGATVAGPNGTTQGPAATFPPVSQTPGARPAESEVNLTPASQTVPIRLELRREK